MFRGDNWDRTLGISGKIRGRRGGSAAAAKLDLLPMSRQLRRRQDAARYAAAAIWARRSARPSSARQSILSAIMRSRSKRES